MNDFSDVYGTIFDIDHFAVHDGPGIRTVIYLKGCPLRCVWCHSPESHITEPQLLHTADNQTGAMCGRSLKASEVVNEVIADKAFFDSSGGGITLSGGEVLFQPEFTESLLEQFNICGIHTVAETSGMGKWQWLERIAKYTNIFYYDIKSLDNEKHIMYTGADNKTILENLCKLVSYMPSGGITLRIPLIPGYNDSIKEIEEVYKFALKIGVYSIHFLRYNTSAPAKYQWLDMQYHPGNLVRQSEEYIDEIRKIGPNNIEVTIF